MDWPLIEQKLESLRRSILRVTQPSLLLLLPISGISKSLTKRFRD